MDVSFCLEALEESFSKGKPEIFNTDQGSRFTSTQFIETLLREEIRVSWDGRGRALDNVFIERLWRSLKYEDVYLRGYKGLAEAREGIAKYFDFYNRDRPHQALRNQTPMIMHFGKREGENKTADLRNLYRFWSRIIPNQRSLSLLFQDKDLEEKSIKLVLSHLWPLAEKEQKREFAKQHLSSDQIKSNAFLR